MRTDARREAQQTTFTRHRFTWLAYAMLAYFAFLQAGLGPAMPFLRAELGLTYTLGGLHVTAFALGMTLAGLFGGAFNARWGRAVGFWGGGGGMALGVLLFVAGRSVFATLPATFVMGLGGTLLLTTLQAALSDLHGARRATAITEGNVIASVGTTFVPLLVGGLADTAAGWRAAFGLMVIVWGGLWLLGRGVPVPPAVRRPASASGEDMDTPLPRRFWAYWVMTALVVAAEWSLVAWSADYLNTVVGLPRETASALMSAFFVAMVIGRLTGSRLTTRYRAEALLPGALGLALLGFLIFWLATAPALNVAGLFVAGLGVANLFPLTLAVTQIIAAEQTDRASARIAFGTGLAILIMPQILGTAADVIGLASAMAVIPALLLGGGVIIGVARRLT